VIPPAGGALAHAHMVRPARQVHTGHASAYHRQPHPTAPPAAISPTARPRTPPEPTRPGGAPRPGWWRVGSGICLVPACRSRVLASAAGTISQGPSMYEMEGPWLALRSWCADCSAPRPHGPPTAVGHPPEAPVSRFLGRHRGCPRRYLSLVVRVFYAPAGLPHKGFLGALSRFFGHPQDAGRYPPPKRDFPRVSTAPSTECSPAASWLRSRPRGRGWPRRGRESPGSGRRSPRSRRAR
jgi:hypothetical protein